MLSHDCIPPLFPIVLGDAGLLPHNMPLLDAGERKVPEIMVRQVQEALSDQLLVLGSLAVELETVKAIASNYSNVCRNMQNKYKYAKYAKMSQIYRI